jgi:hypothetical protein
MADNKLQTAVKRFMTKVAKGFEEYLKRKLSHDYVPPKGSSPGYIEYPHRRTGSLQASVGFEPHRSKNGEVSITIGIVKDIQLGGKKERPTLYGAELEWEMGRLLVEQAFDEYWKSIDHYFLIKLDGMKVAKKITINRLTTGGRTELFDLVGLDDLFEEDSGQPTLTAMSV